MSKKVKRTKEAKRSLKTSEITTETKKKDSEISELTEKHTMEQIMEMFSPKKMTSKQEKASDEVEDKRKMAATQDTVMPEETRHLFDNEQSELIGSESAKQGEELLTKSHGDVMLETMEQGLIA